jgi:hypothetical protein
METNDTLALYICTENKGKLIRGQRICEFSDGFYMARYILVDGVYEIVKGDRIDIEQYTDVLLQIS